jgi:hypothetical protein
MRAHANRLLVLSSLCAAALASCGPATPTPVAGPAAPTGAPDAGQVAPTAALDPGKAPAPSATAEPGKPPPTPAPPKSAGSRPLGASSMIAEVQKLGVDTKKMPPLEKIPLATKKKLMPLFQKALGYPACTGCHLESDYKADTGAKKMARAMWNHFLVELRDDKGGALFCDSCHGGATHILDRSDKDAVVRFMETEYDAKLGRADGGEHGCKSCHGDPMETKIFAKLWGIK